MAAELRDEFEDYVRKLTTAICKDIFLEQMQQLYTKYESGYEKYSAAVEKATRAGASLEKEVHAVDQSIANLTKDVQMSLETISRDIGVMESSTDDLFHEMKRLDDEARTGMAQELDSYIEKYKSGITQTFTEGCMQISDKLAGVVTPEILQQFADSLEEHTKETKEMVSFINGAYKEEAEKGIRQMVEENLGAQRKVDAAFSERVNRLVVRFGEAEQAAQAAMEKKAQEVSDRVTRQAATFAQYLAKLLEGEKTRREEALERQMERMKELLEDEKAGREEALERQMDMIKEIWQGDGRIRLLQEKLNLLQQTMEEMDSQNAKYSQDLSGQLVAYREEQNALEQKNRERPVDMVGRIPLGWRVYMAASNTLILFCFGVVAYFLLPWELLGMKDTLLAVVVFMFVIVCQAAGILGFKKVRKSAKKAAG